MKKPILWLLLSCLFLTLPGAAKPKANAGGGLPPGDLVGPSKITLGDKLATLDLPAGYAFYNKQTTMKLMVALGNKNDGKEVGSVRAADDTKLKWLVLIGYDDTGHVKDDEKIDADKLLQSMKEGTEAQNEERKQKGIPELHVTGWLEAPRYEAEVHHVVWAPKAELISDGKTMEIVNYNTRILSRTGVLYLNLLTSMDNLASCKADAEKLLAATSFNDGQKYENFKSGDKMAEYGLMGLILGGSLVVAKKAGLLFVLFKSLGFILLKLKAAAVFLVAGIAAGFKKLGQLFTGRRDTEAGVHRTNFAPPSPPSPPEQASTPESPDE